MKKKVNCGAISVACLIWVWPILLASFAMSIYSTYKVNSVGNTKDQYANTCSTNFGSHNRADEIEDHLTRTLWTTIGITRVETESLPYKDMHTNDTLYNISLLCAEYL